MFHVLRKVCGHFTMIFHAACGHSLIASIFGASSVFPAMKLPSRIQKAQEEISFRRDLLMSVGALLIYVLNREARSDAMLQLRTGCKILRRG